MFVLCEEAKRKDVVGLFGFRPPRIPGSLQLVPMTRIGKLRSKPERVVGENEMTNRAGPSFYEDRQAENFPTTGRPPDRNWMDMKRVPDGRGMRLGTRWIPGLNIPKIRTDLPTPN